jgi:prepilin signal peptidase PulO-like enzyme (type II secretory pathway)
VGLLVCWIGIAVIFVACAEHRATGSAPAPSLLLLSLAFFAAVLAVALGPTLAEGAARGITCIALIFAASADHRTGLLFDAITFPTALLSAGVGVLLGDTANAVNGVTILVGAFGLLVAASRGRAMGLGDVKAMFAVGAAFGPIESLIAIFGACASGILTTLLAGRLRRGAVVRFGPHLAAGTLLALVFGNRISHYVVGQ